MPITTKHSEFLYQLRDEGSTNMLEAGPYLEKEFGLNRNEANSILKEWIKSFNKEPTTTVSLGDILDSMLERKKIQCQKKE